MTKTLTLAEIQKEMRTEVMRLRMQMQKIQAAVENLVANVNTGYDVSLRILRDMRDRFSLVEEDRKEFDQVIKQFEEQNIRALTKYLDDIK